MSAGQAGRMATLAALAGGLATFSAGTTLAAIRFVAEASDPLSITVVRIGIGVAILLPFALWFGRGWPRGREALRVAAWGVLFFAVCQWLVSVSLTHTSAARAGVIASAVPFVTLVLAAAVRAERLTALKVAGVGLATGGVALALWRDASAVPGGWLGDAAMLLTATLFSIYNVGTRRIVRNYPPLVWFTANAVPGFLVLAAVGLASGLHFGPGATTAEGLAAFAYIGVAGSAVAYFLWLWALRHTTPTRVAVALTMNPVGAILAGAVVLGETISPGMLAGLAAVLTGIVLTNWRGKGERAAPEAPR